MIRYFFSKQFGTFLFTGGVAALVNFVSRVWISKFIEYSIAIVLAYIIGMITAFILAKLFVFSVSNQNIRRSVLYFILVNIVALIQTWLISTGLVYYVFPLLGVRYFTFEIAHAIGLAVPVVTSYIGHKQLSFKKSDYTEDI
ncbi:MAG: GtrA family protein [Chlorobium sp.]|nr:MAG: GtrA family protein [Chlorobium sp.]